MLASEKNKPTLRAWTLLLESTLSSLFLTMVSNRSRNSSFKTDANAVTQTPHTTTRNGGMYRPSGYSRTHPFSQPNGVLLAGDLYEY
jgi:hypothetical protein